MGPVERYRREAAQITSDSFEELPGCFKPLTLGCSLNILLMLFIIVYILR